jgi:hypothetical protein
MTTYARRNDTNWTIDDFVKRPEGSTPVLRPARQHPDGDEPEGDLFSTSTPWLILLVMIIPYVALLIWLVAVYGGVEYGSPPWNTHSVPPPRLY